jgi:hypothetical protein
MVMDSMDVAGGGLRGPFRRYAAILRALAGVDELSEARNQLTQRAAFLAARRGTWDRVSEGCGISSSEWRDGMIAASNLRARAREVRKSPAAFSKYTVEFVGNLRPDE